LSSLRAFSPSAPLLLVTDYPASAGGGGAVILRSLLREPADRDAVVWASPSPATDAHRQDVTLVPSSGAVAKLLGRRSVAADSLLAGRLADDIEAVARARGARAIWIVMHGPLVHVAARLLERTRRPVHLTVHDDPAFGVALMSRRYAALAPLIELDFARALRAARSIDVICDNMAERYRRRYGVGSVVVHRGLWREVAARPALADDSHLDVGVMGNTYGYSQLPLLAQAVERVARAIGKRPRVTVVGAGLGARLAAEFQGRVEVDVPGHMDEAHAAERLARCFALYLNYPFSRRAAVLRQTSFPTKLSSYLLAARPLLMHAPSDSSIAHLIDMPGFVGWWGDESVDAGARVLRALWDSPAAHASQHEPAEQLRRRHYDLETNRRTLFGALDALVT
jgi:hypothetical protein